MEKKEADSVDTFIIVTEPIQRSIQTARVIRRLALDIKIRNILVVCNKIRNPKEREIMTNGLSDFNLLGFISYNSELMEADKNRNENSE
ncbi:MAG: hypothetical protein QME40_04575 [bacterium]|nr:hypothetical protein [bacterium]